MNIQNTCRILAVTAGLTTILTTSLSARAQTLADPPEDQGVYVDGTATFTVVPKVAGLAFQWIRMSPEGYVELPGATNQDFTLSDIRVDDVGWYACRLTAGDQTEFSKAASLTVVVPPVRSFSTMRSSSYSLSSADSMTAIATSSMSACVYAAPALVGGASGDCPGSYAGYVQYTLPLAQGWGWAPASDTSFHIASDITRTDTKVKYVGRYGDAGCGQTSVTIPHPTASPKYRFTIYFPNDVPVTSYPIQLDGFIF